MLDSEDEGLTPADMFSMYKKIPEPVPHKNHDFCSVCKCSYTDYFEHLADPNHKNTQLASTSYDEIDKLISFNFSAPSTEPNSSESMKDAMMNVSRTVSTSISATTADMTPKNTNQAPTV